MGTTAPQQLKITYGGFVVGEGEEESYVVRNGFSFRQARLEGTVGFQVVVFGTSYADLHTKCIALTAAFRERRERLIIEVDGNIHHDLNPSTTINKNLVSEITQSDDDVFTGITRSFDISIAVDLPPSEANGRTETNVNLSKACNGIRTLTVSAQYNSTSLASAKTLMEADFDDYVDNVQDKFDSSIEWKFDSETIQSDDILNDQQLTVTRVYTEITHKVVIKYGAFTAGDGVGGTYRIMNGWSVQSGRLTGNVAFTVQVASATATALAIDCNDLEEAFREQRKTLELIFETVTHRKYEGANVHVNSQSSSTGQDDPCFSGNLNPEGKYLRNYSVSVDVDMFPLESNGRTEGEVTLNFTPSRKRQITIQVAYNSVTGTGAYALYTADIDAYAASVITSLGGGGVFEMSQEPSVITIPVIDNQISVSRTYTELLFDQSDGLRNDPDLVNFTITVEGAKNFPGDFIPTTVSRADVSRIVGDTSGTPKRLIDITTTVSTAVIHTQTQDLQTLYADKIREYMITHTKDETGVALLAVISESVTTDPVENTINAVMGFSGAIDGAGQLLESTMKTSINLIPGRNLVGAHDGKKFTKFKIETKATKTRTIETTRLIVSNQTNPDTPTIPDDGDTGWIFTGAGNSAEPKTLGNIAGGANESFNIVLLSNTQNQEYIDKPDTKAPITVPSRGRV